MEKKYQKEIERLRRDIKKVENCAVAKHSYSKTVLDGFNTGATTAVS